MGQLPRRNPYIAWLVAAAVIAVVGLVKLATHGENGIGYLGLAVVIAWVVRDRNKRRLRGPTRAELAADRLHRRLFGSPQSKR